VRHLAGLTELEAEPLPDDAIAGTADPGAPWNHAAIEVASPQAIPDGQSPWDQPVHGADAWTKASTATPPFTTAVAPLAPAVSEEWAGASVPREVSPASGGDELWPAATIVSAPAAAASTDIWSAPLAPAAGVQADPQLDQWSAPAEGLAAAAAEEPWTLEAPKSALAPAAVSDWSDAPLLAAPAIESDWSDAPVAAVTMPIAESDWSDAPVAAVTAPLGDSEWSDAPVAVVSGAGSDWSAGAPEEPEWVAPHADSAARSGATAASEATFIGRPSAGSASSAPAGGPESEPWEASTQAGFAIEPLDPQGSQVAPIEGESPFAPLAPGATLAGEDDFGLDTGAGQGPSGDAAHEAPPIDLDDENLLVPIDEPEPERGPVPTGLLAIPGEHRVAVHTRAGRTRRGVVRDIDLAAESFLLLPQAGGPPELIHASEVKAIFFMLQPGERPGPGDGHQLRVTFEDGRTIEGVRDGVEAPDGFFLVPGDAARTNTRRIFIARAAVQELRGW
jgi:hypothetical protein